MLSVLVRANSSVCGGGFTAHRDFTDDRSSSFRRTELSPRKKRNFPSNRRRLNAPISRKFMQWRNFMEAPRGVRH
jgi:hypothetical protein